MAAILNFPFIGMGRIFIMVRCWDLMRGDQKIGNSEGVGQKINDKNI